MVSVPICCRHTSSMMVVKNGYQKTKPRLFGVPEVRALRSSCLSWGLDGVSGVSVPTSQGIIQTLLHIPSLMIDDFMHKLRTLRV